MNDPVVPVLVAALDPSCDGDVLVFAKKLRHAGVACTIDTRHKRIKKIYDYAVALRCFYVVFIGPTETASGVVSVKDLDEKTQESMTPEAAIALLAYTCLTNEEKLAIARKETASPGSYP